ncbi:Histidine--tRNA ligase [Dissostichus eleginoides]|uniref:Histidine--tRNA ligase n=1 Tax=Dissostichus eleginoides TaxID=100907 RepID=A0AAD9C7Q3_DISEL|nr:Histidine--tRNA ligase [Dissostichus eleginoides]
MDDLYGQRLNVNKVNYKRSLERIIDKYSKLQYHDAGQEVDLYNTEARTLEGHMELSKIELSKLDSKSIEELREESISSRDITGTSQLDFTYQDGRADASCSVIHMSVEDDGVASNETTHLSAVSLDQSQINISFTDFQPEDQDEELDMT